jgi:hypothetical protein
MGQKLNIKSDAKLLRCICAIASEEISASFLGAFAKLLKVTVCPMERLGSY